MITCRSTLANIAQAGDGNLHGLEREISPAVAEMHRAIRRALDPYGILNPANPIG